MQQVLSLSQRLGVLPEVLNRLLIGVVVLSMALTPALSSLGAVLSEKLTQWALSQGLDDLASLEPRPPQEGEGKGIGGSEMVVICGFGPVGQIVGRCASACVCVSGCLCAGAWLCVCACECGCVFLCVLVRWSGCRPPPTPPSSSLPWYSIGVTTSHGMRLRCHSASCRKG